MKSIAIASTLLVTSLCSMASACPLCRDATVVSNSGGTNAHATLFNFSVLGMLGAFLVVAGLLIAKIAHAIRLLDRSVLKNH